MSALLGIDIGSTNISAVVYDSALRKVICTRTLPNSSKMKTDCDFAEFDAKKIIEITLSLANELTEKIPDIKAIGVTGQMHGVVYLSRSGEIVSPLYSWQDKRGNRAFFESKTYCDEIKERTGESVNSGYGFATLFYNKINGIEDKGAYTFCSIADALVMALTGRKTPIIHPSFAASFGLFDVKKNCFLEKAINALELSPLALPEISEDTVAGYFNGIPVSVAIGDNQASFFGSAEDNEGALINFGTGSQISVVTDDYINAEKGLEVRPYLFGKYLLCGSALCGGKAYAILENFFSEYAKALGINEKQYETMNALAQKAYEKGEVLKVLPLFCGTRENPELRGSVADISDFNFTPGNLVLGTLYGMANELKGYFDLMGIKNVGKLTASGNAVKKNEVLKKVIKDVFSLPLNLTENDEEAAIGVAMYAGIVADEKI